MGIFDGILESVIKPIGGIVKDFSPLISGVFGYSGQQEVNETNQQIANQNTAFNAAEADKARIFNAGQSELQRGWAENLSNTSYRRAVNDMQGAGLNPMLAYSQGGASTPSGASASGPSATAAANPVIGNKNTAAISTAQLASQVQNTLAHTENVKADTALKVADLPRTSLGGQLREQEIEFVRNQAREMMERIYGTHWEATLKEQRVKLGEVQAIVAKLVADKERITTEKVLNELEIKGEAGARSRYFENMGPTRYGLRDLGSLIGSAADARRAFRGGR